MNDTMDKPDTGTATAGEPPADKILLDKNVQSPNGKVKAGVKVTHQAPAPEHDHDEQPCEDCAGESGGGARALGLIILTAAGFGLYVGLDLITGGALSRRFGARPAGDEDDSQ